jgi:predicted nucleotidyltransferase
MDDYILQFRNELIARSPREICRRFLIFGNCQELFEERYYSLKAAIAEEFHIHPNEVVVVGSTKLGFSIVPGKRYRPFGESSDIDVAIVSPKLFDRVWQEVFEYLSSASSWHKRAEFAQYFVRGWVRPDKLPSGPTFRFTDSWFGFFRSLSNSREFGDIPISGGLYRDWLFLERYQEQCIAWCREIEIAQK